jgi:hypothetical protein
VALNNNHSLPVFNIKHALRRNILLAKGKGTKTQTMIYKTLQRKQRLRSNTKKMC